MNVRVFKLGDVVLYPVTKMHPKTREVQIIDSLYALPGRRVVPRHRLHALANNLCQPLTSHKTKLCVPVEWERKLK
jgi:hypothetical protein